MSTANPDQKTKPIGNRSNLQAMRTIAIILIFLLTLTSMISITTAERDYNLSFFSNGSTRDFVPPVMEFGANVDNNPYHLLTMSTDFFSEDAERKHVYIQFHGRLTHISQREELQEKYGIKIVSKTAGYGTYIASMPASMTAADIPAESGLRWMGEIPPEDKWDSVIYEIPETERLDNGMVIIAVRMYKDVEIAAAQQFMDKYANTSSIYEDYTQYDNHYLEYLFVTEEESLSSMTNEDIVWMVIFRSPPMEPLNSSDDASQTVLSDISTNDSTILESSTSIDSNVSSTPDTNGDKTIPGFSSFFVLICLISIYYMIFRRCSP